MKNLISVLLLPLLFACAPMTQPKIQYLDGQGQSGLTGQVLLKKDQQPLSGVYVNVYPEDAPNLLGPSRYISIPTGADGLYTLEVPPGKYFVVARKRVSGLATGPLAPGDFFSEDARLAVEVKSGKLARIDLPMINMTAPMFFKRGFGDIATETGVRGVLVDETGKPVPGGFAIAYRDSNIQRLPDYASTLSNQKGEFTLFLPEGGTYYLAARVHAWDMPRPGEPYGKYDGAELKPLSVPDKGFVRDLRIVMLPFDGVYKEGMNKKPF